MERKELLSSREYWLAKVQTQLFAVVEDYIKEKKLNRTLFAKEIGVTKGYVSQVLNGDYDNRISKFIELSLSVGKVPLIEFKDINEFIQKDASLEEGAVFFSRNASYSITFNVQQNINITQKDFAEGKIPMREHFKIESSSSPTPIPLSILTHFESLNK